LEPAPTIPRITLQKMETGRAMFTTMPIVSRRSARSPFFPEPLCYGILMGMNHLHRGWGRRGAAHTGALIRTERQCHRDHLLTVLLKEFRRSSSIEARFTSNRIVSSRNQSLGKHDCASPNPEMIEPVQLISYAIQMLGIPEAGSWLAKS
jgi:hypothetical protein